MPITQTDGTTERRKASNGPRLHTELEALLTTGVREPFERLGSTPQQKQLSSVRDRKRRESMRTSVVAMGNVTRLFHLSHRAKRVIDLAQTQNSGEEEGRTRREEQLRGIRPVSSVAGKTLVVDGVGSPILVQIECDHPASESHSDTAHRQGVQNIPRVVEKVSGDRISC